MKFSTMTVSFIFCFLLLIVVSAQDVATMESELAQVTTNKISRGVYQTTQPIDLRKLRRMLNEGGRDQDQAQDDDDEEDEDMESTSDISIEAHEDGSVTIKITSYNPQFVKEYLGMYTDVPTMAPSVTVVPTAYDTYFLYGRTSNYEAGQQGVSKQDKAWIATSTLLLVGAVCATLYSRFQKKKAQKQQQAKIACTANLVSKGGNDGTSSETPYKRSDLA